jgi:nitrate/TMAO reductase-like tetraheme cytochrome c subunit
MHVSPLSWIAFTCGVLAAMIIVWYVIRRPPLTLGVKGALFMGLGVLPILTALVGNVEGLHATKNIEFCGSCHVMDAHVGDALDPNSMSLAAVHTRIKKIGDESCYTCHADYGIYGFVLTKLGGMGHVYEYLTGFSSMTLEEALPKIHLKRPFKNENCMECHSTQGAIWGDLPDHRGLVDDLRSGQTSCVSAGCHGYAHPFSKPEQETL